MIGAARVIDRNGQDIPHALFETLGATVFATYAAVLYPPRFVVARR